MLFDMVKSALSSWATFVCDYHISTGALGRINFFVSWTVVTKQQEMLKFALFPVLVSKIDVQ